MVTVPNRGAKTAIANVRDLRVFQPSALLAEEIHPRRKPCRIFIAATAAARLQVPGRLLSCVLFTALYNKQGYIRSPILPLSVQPCLILSFLNLGF